MNDDIMTGQLKIDLADKLRIDQQCSIELVNILQDCGQQVKVDASDERITGQEYAKHTLEIVARLAQFACAHSNTRSSLTAKLVCASRLGYCESDLNKMKVHNSLVLNTHQLLNEIINQHPDTWQATVAHLKLVNMIPRNNERNYHEEKIRLLRDILKKELVELPTDDTEFDACFGWVTYSGPPFKATILRAIATIQHNLGIFDGYDAYWLNEARHTQQEILDKYPDSKWSNHAIDDIRTIDNILEHHCK